MEVTRDTLRLFTTIAGGLVLVAYAYGVSRMEDATALWGCNWLTPTFQYHLHVRSSRRIPTLLVDGPV